jgi:hypothetical protein
MNNTGLVRSRPKVRFSKPVTPVPANTPRTNEAAISMLRLRSQHKSANQSSPPRLTPSMGACAPTNTGMDVPTPLGQASRVAHTFPTTLPMSVLPCTHVIATISISPEESAHARRARINACASSIPASVSMISCLRGIPARQA